MSEELYPYDTWVAGALQGVLKTALRQLERHGFTGDHHFYINFDTTQPGVRMPGFLRAQYPEEITIVLQHQFDDLLIADDFFEVTLSFSGQKQRLHVPFDAVKSLADPSVNFGLQIGMLPTPWEAGPEPPEAKIKGSTWRGGSIGEVDHSELDQPRLETGSGSETGEAEESEEREAVDRDGATVITLDQFRKKNS